jgi:hypothetical protein
MCGFGTVRNRVWKERASEREKMKEDIHTIMWLLRRLCVDDDDDDDGAMRGGEGEDEEEHVICNW